MLQLLARLIGPLTALRALTGVPFELRFGLARWVVAVRHLFGLRAMRMWLALLRHGYHRFCRSLVS